MDANTNKKYGINNGLSFNYDKLDKASNLMSKNFEKMDNSQPS